MTKGYWDIAKQLHEQAYRQMLGDIDLDELEFAKREQRRRESKVAKKRNERKVRQ